MHRFGVEPLMRVLAGSPFTETFAYASRARIHPMHALAIHFYARLPPQRALDGGGRPTAGSH